jgi:aspartate kinase
VCFENTYNNLDRLLQHLKAKFKVTLYDNVSLYTVRHYNEQAIASVEKNKKLLLKQLTQETIQIVTQ